MAQRVSSPAPSPAENSAGSEPRDSAIDAEILPTQQPSRQTQQARRENRSFTITSEQYSGLVPHPEHIERFDRVFPGAAKIIFSEFQAQGEHRRRMESRVITTNILSSVLGQVLSFVLLGGISAGGIWLEVVSKLA